MVKAYVLDASALFIFLQRKAGAAKINELLKEAMHARIQVLMSAANFGEVYGKVLREHGIDRATSTINSVASLPIGLLDVTRQRAIHAADTGVKYELHYTDSFAAALAIEQKATLITSDSDFRKLGHGFPILWLKP